MQTVVVIGSAGDSDNPWDLPASRVIRRPWIQGGERTLFELAFALAELGTCRVELLGNISSAVFDELAAVTNRRPEIDLPARRPTSNDFVIVSEGIVDPLGYARVALSDARRRVLLLLAPPGLFGWPFVQRWTPPDPLSVDIDAVARPEHFRAMAALGFELWTHSLGLQAASEGAGVACTWIGSGSPGAAPPAPSKTADVVVVDPNRWAPLAHAVVDRLEDAVWITTGEGSHQEILNQLGRAKVLVWPCRVEGHSRIACEARAMGTVPVVLGSNRFGAGLTAEDGAVVVSSLDEMVAATSAVLGDPARLAVLSERGARFSSSWTSWEPYKERVRAALATDAPSPDNRGALAAFGHAVEAAHASRRSRVRTLLARMRR